MEKGQFIKYLVIMIAILGVAFLSQKAYSMGIGKTLVSNATDQAKAYMAKGSDWAMSTVYPKISGEVQKRGDIIKNEVSQEKEKVSENIGTKISNYFSGIANSVVNPGASQDCPSSQTTTNTN